MNLPRVLTAELTYRCNHSCLFCSCPWEADKSVKETELSTREWHDVFRVVKKYGVEQVTFSGGEATIREDFFEILDAATALGLSLGVISNGYRIDEAFLHRLQKYHLLLSISIPGIDTFARITGHDNIAHILNLFDMCRKIGIQTVANIAVTKLILKNFIKTSHFRSFMVRLMCF